MTNKELFKETDNPFFLSNKTERDKEDKNECNSPKNLNCLLLFQHIKKILKKRLMKF